MLRDLAKDLELISKATPGPWERNEKPSFGDWWVQHGNQHICLLPSDKKGTHFGEMFKANAEFIAAAREGWPHAIERALKAEAEVERLTAENCPNCGANMTLEDSAKEQLQKELAQLAIESVEREKALAKLEAEVAVWTQAEADGRLVVLPCKVGDTVWVIASCEDVAKSRDDDYFNGTGEITCPYENTCEIEECADDNIRVFETSINCVVIEEDGKFTFWVDTLLISFGISKIGKTVFLTREEAEAALRKEQGDGRD